MPTILVSGASRGIGRCLVEKYMNQPNTTVLATARNLASVDARALLSIPAAQGSRIIVLKVESTSDTDAAEAISYLESQGITTIDIVIANAGTFTPKAYKPVANLRITDLKEHFDINTIGHVRLFQATLPLLKRSPNPKFIMISSFIGTIGGLKDVPYPNSVYGASKAAANYLTRKIHFEHDDIAALAIHPGAVKTDSGHEAIKAMGVTGGIVEVEESVEAMMDEIRAVTKENGSGEFWNYDGRSLPW